MWCRDDERVGALFLYLGSRGSRVRSNPQPAYLEVTTAKLLQASQMAHYELLQR